jgi:4-hydroxy-tetrahydrodipicolinate reductase
VDNLIRIVQVGLGPIGCSILLELHRRDDYLIVGGIDQDPQKIGKDVGEVVGNNAAMDLPVEPQSDSILNQMTPDVAVLATSWSLAKVRPIILDLVHKKVNVISTCEELVFPWTSHAEIAKELDAAARSNEVSILSTGVNPGFVMDYLVAVTSGLTREVKNIEVERFLDAGTRRAPFQRKVGAGLSPEEFQAAASAGDLRHVGLRESVEFIARSLHWRLAEVEETLEGVVATEPMPSYSGEVSAGKMIGVEQTATGFDDERKKIALHFKASLGEVEPRDRIIIDGTPRIDLKIEGGVHGDLATCNVVVNSIRPLLDARPGLLTMLDIRAPAFQEPTAR